MPAPAPARDSGFTLIEVIVTLALMSVLMAFAVSGWSSWAKTRAHSGAAQELHSMLRQAQQRAVTEGRAMCVTFDAAAGSYTAYRGSCAAADKEAVASPFEMPGTVHLSAPAFGPTDAKGPSLEFSARGSAWPGAVRITRDGSSKVYVIKVEGLTGRVSLH